MDGQRPHRGESEQVCLTGTVQGDHRGLTIANRVDKLLALAWAPQLQLPVLCSLPLVPRVTLQISALLSCLWVMFSQHPVRCAWSPGHSL